MRYDNKKHTLLFAFRAYLLHCSSPSFSSEVERRLGWTWQQFASVVRALEATLGFLLQPAMVVGEEMLLIVRLLCSYRRYAADLPLAGRPWWRGEEEGKWWRWRGFVLRVSSAEAYWRGASRSYPLRSDKLPWGKRLELLLEATPSSNKRHLLLRFFLTLMFLLSAGRGGQEEEDMFCVPVAPQGRHRVSVDAALGSDSFDRSLPI
jgi:hypothetical protein